VLPNGVGSDTAGTELGFMTQWESCVSISNMQWQYRGRKNFQVVLAQSPTMGRCSPTVLVVIVRTQVVS
jgi:ABC-type Fe2+-enterobactin transport system substrate-binding protein